jgi:hypothetical protein
MSDEGTFLAKGEQRGPSHVPLNASAKDGAWAMLDLNYSVRSPAPAEIAILVDMAVLTLPK